jgi:hypothetical protein
MKSHCGWKCKGPGAQTHGLGACGPSAGERLIPQDDVCAALPYSSRCIRLICAVRAADLKYGGPRCACFPLRLRRAAMPSPNFLFFGKHSARDEGGRLAVPLHCRLPPNEGQGKPSPYKTYLVAALPRYAASPACLRRQRPPPNCPTPPLSLRNTGLMLL